MKTILLGYPGSRTIRNASTYLFEKYMPKEFEAVWLEYDGEIGGWSAFIADYLRGLPDRRVMFSLDDYLISGEPDMDGYRNITGRADVIKLCFASPDENKEYPVTTQYTEWDREMLIGLLEKTTTPWSFEIDGSRVFNGSTLFANVIPYYTNSSLSSRWEGVRLDGLMEEDIKQIQQWI
jgi:hypothetical protein